ncbi:hypothetical protein CEUSTIGMA_g10786.t1 [Chlamydomonas eustigma]|uniref:Uncharacterized protein n=1 Tax=Chlamydomonas eustigma TaxID=1157962 RepID=A0A250XJU6_9CHLO|nr:hypothetical protein CEUSTIGMA_g10786.t1 [Chlamydomonas eustigma]|eukprot:GAX83361.1 hypothetical protein CEUSTIGMA_g10786.t1 [Chlamydomonas eustigma]
MSADVSPPARGELDKSAVVLDTNIQLMQTLYADAGHAVAGALETFKVFKPEIARLDGHAYELEKKLDLLKTGTQSWKETVLSSQEVMEKKLKEMEERMLGFDAFVAALPTWKEDVMSKMDAMGRDTRYQHEQLVQRTSILEDNLSHHSQSTRERLDSLMALAKVSTDARAAQTIRIDELENVFRQFELSANMQLSELESSSRKHEEVIMVNSRHITELNIKLSMSRIDLEAVRERIVMLEGVDGDLRGELMQLKDRVDGAEASLGMNRKHLEQLDTHRGNLQKRIDVIERDPRIPRLLDVAEDFKSFKQKMEFQNEASNMRLEAFNTRLNTLDTKVDRGPPGLWKLTEEVTAHAETIKNSAADLKTARRALDVMERNMLELRGGLQRAHEVQEEIQLENTNFNEKLNAGIKRAIQYTDSRLDNVVARHEVESMRVSVGELRKELHEAISNMGMKVKFDLLHDESPQVDTIKEYMEKVEQVMARNQEQIAFLEEGLLREEARGKSIEHDWSGVRDTLNALVINGELDVVKLRRDLTSIKSMFEEMGRLAFKGDILTANEAENLMDQKMHGPSMDGVLARKVHEKGPFASFLSSLATKHEVEAMRKILLECSHRLLIQSNMGGQGQPALMQQHYQDAVLSTQAAEQDLLPAAPHLSMHAPNAIASAGPNSRPHSAAVKGGTTEPPLVLLYKRAASVEELAARSQSHCQALEEKFKENERTLALVLDMVERHVPKLEEQSSGMRLPGPTRSGTRDQQELAQAALQLQTSAKAEEAVRQAVNNTLLPDIIGRQVSEAQRLTRYVDDAMSKLAKEYEVEALRRSLVAIKAQVEEVRRHTGAPPVPMLMLPSEGGAQHSQAALLPLTSPSQPHPGSVSSAGLQWHSNDTSPPLSPYRKGGGPTLQIDITAGPPAAAAAALPPEPSQQGPSDIIGRESGRLLDSEAQLRVLTLRLSQVEGEIAGLRRPINLGTSHESTAPGDKMLTKEVADLKAQLSELLLQQPLLAKTYELEGLKRTLLNSLGKPQGPAQNASVVLEAGADESIAGKALIEELKKQHERSAEWQERMDKAELLIHTLEEQLKASEKLWRSSDTSHKFTVANMAEALPKIQQEMKDVKSELQSGNREYMRNLMSQQGAQWQQIMPTATVETLPAAAAAAAGVQGQDGTADVSCNELRPTSAAAAAASAPWISAAAGNPDALFKEQDYSLGSIQAARRFMPPSPEIMSAAAVAANLPHSVLPFSTAIAGTAQGSENLKQRTVLPPERTDAELAGLVYDLVHLEHEELVVMREGPLPGADSSAAARFVREAALRRLRAKPVEVQKHVGLLEGAKKQLSRLMSTAATSTVDYLCMGLVIMDTRLKLMEDRLEESRDQMASVFMNLETTFDYMRRLQEAVNGKASAYVVARLDQTLRAMGKECLIMGPALDLLGKDGALTGSKLCDPDFWGTNMGEGDWEVVPPPLITNSAAPQLRNHVALAERESAITASEGRSARSSSAHTAVATRPRSPSQNTLPSDQVSPTRPVSPPHVSPGQASSSGNTSGLGTASLTMALPGDRVVQPLVPGSTSIGAAGTASRSNKLRPSTATSSLVSTPMSRRSSAPMNLLSGAFMGGAPFPPPNFMREKRNILEEQERMLSIQQQVQQQGHGDSRPRSSLLAVSVIDAEGNELPVESHSPIAPWTGVSSAGSSRPVTPIVGGDSTLTHQAGSRSRISSAAMRAGVGGNHQGGMMGDSALPPLPSIQQGGIRPVSRGT